MEQCERFLGHDYQQVNRFSNCGDFVCSLRQNQDLYSGQMTPILVNRLEPCLGRLQEFTSVMDAVMWRVTFRGKTVWDILDILIEVISYNPGST